MKLILTSILMAVILNGHVLGALKSQMNPNSDVSRDSSTTPVAAKDESKKQANSPTYADVAAILDDHCIMCHSGEKPPIGLKLDSYPNVMAGSNKGTVVLAGNTSKSELVRRIRGISKPRMPLNGPPWLSNEEVTLIEQWIKAGAPDAKSESKEVQTSLRSGEQAGSSDQPITYAQVAPIFIKRCIKCHSEKGIMGNPPEGFLMEDYGSIISGSERARVIPGLPAASELVRRIEGQALPRMPLDGPPYLEKTEIELISKWIEEGTRSSNGEKAPLPVGAKVRIHGTLTGHWSLDGMLLAVDKRSRFKKNPSVGSYVQVRGIVRNDGRILAMEIRPR